MRNLGLNPMSLGLDLRGGVYVLLDGRLKVYKVEEDGSESPLAEMAAGATVGEIQVMTGGARSATVRAAADSELAKIPTAVFDELAHAAGLYTVYVSNSFVTDEALWFWPHRHQTDGFFVARLQAER